MKIILFSGKAEAGKTTAAKILKEVLVNKYNQRVAIIPYAAYLKHTAELVFGWDGEKNEEGRHLLQWWGTDVVRAKLPDFWVDSVVQLACVSENQLDYILIDDARFPNEITAWDRWTHMLVRVERPGYLNHLTEEQRNHISETALDNYPCDVIVSATNWFELAEAVRDNVVPMVIKLKEKNNVI